MPASNLARGPNGETAIGLTQGCPAKDSNMTLVEVKMVRIYLTEAERRLDELLELLHDREKVRGVTVYRGISGFGKSGKMHSSRLLDLSMDLPVIIEFFDDPDKIDMITEHLAKLMEPGHMVIWSAKINE